MISIRQILLFAAATGLCSCASWLPDAHRIDIVQGNAIEREALNRVRTGMKKTEITQIIGRPLIQDPFHAARWDYVYRYVPGHGEPVQSRLTLYFDGDILVRIDDSEYREPVTMEDTSEAEPGPVEAVPRPEVD